MIFFYVCVCGGGGVCVAFNGHLSYSTPASQHYFKIVSAHCIEGRPGLVITFFTLLALENFHYYFPGK